MKWNLHQDLNDFPSWEHRVLGALNDSDLTQLKKYAVDKRFEFRSAAIVSNDQDINNSIRSTEVKGLIEFNDLAWLYSKLTKLINQVNEQHYKWILSDLEVLQYGIYHSSRQGFYTVHTDSALKGFGGMNRKLSFSILLNDPSEFEGGDLILMPSKDGIKIDLDRGEAVFFPSFMPHQVTPVTKGERHSLVGWIQGPNFV